MKTAYIIYNDEAEIMCITLSQAEALYQIWRLCMQVSKEDLLPLLLEENGYDTLEKLEEDWLSGALGNELWLYFYEEYQISNDLGLE